MNNNSNNGRRNAGGGNGQQTYIEIEVQLRQSAEWMGELKQVMQEAYVPVRWQNGYYHITLAFLEKVPSIEEVIAIMNRHLASFEAPELTFDKLDAFGKRSGGGVVFLTCSEVPESFMQMVDALRQDLEAAGCMIESDFKLHVTLGRVNKDVHVEADLLRELTESVDVPAFSLRLNVCNYKDKEDHRTLHCIRLKSPVRGR
ncbi:MAG: 2'-5' RNA ligase family protein [Bacteroidales bacterium]|nr:2'-5' RNA ligase family protein [Bacteroidales bacterium]